MKWTTWIFRLRSRKVHDGIIRHNRTKRAALKNPKRISVTLNPIFLLFKTVRYAAWMWIPSQSKSRLRCHPCPSHGSGGGFERYDESEEESPTLQLLNEKRRKQRFFIHISVLMTLFGALESGGKSHFEPTGPFGGPLVRRRGYRAVLTAERDRSRRISG